MGTSPDSVTLILFIPFVCNILLGDRVAPALVGISAFSAGAVEPNIRLHDIEDREIGMAGIYGVHIEWPDGD